MALRTSPRASVGTGAAGGARRRPGRLRRPPAVRRRARCALSQVEVSRRVTLEKLPPVLVLHLKRFVYEKTGGCQKLVKSIEYPVDLEISKGNSGGRQERSWRHCGDAGNQPVARSLRFSVPCQDSEARSPDFFVLHFLTP